MDTAERKANALALWRSAIDVVVAARQRVVRAVLRQLWPCWTRTAGSLAFDGGVFLALALMAGSLVTPWSVPLAEGRGWMLACLGAFAAFWCSIAATDLDRFRTLRRRFLRRADAAPVRRRAVRVAQSESQAPAAPRIRSAYRPVRPVGALPSRSLLRFVGRGH